MSVNPPRVPPVMFRPTVVVGLGGMGTFVAYRVMELVRRQLDRQVRAGLITERVAEQALADRFKFVGIDSDNPWYRDKFGPQFFRIGTTTDVNATLERRYLRENEFQRWWHRLQNGKWWMPNDYAFGAGHIRLKGRLAYFLEREQGTLDAGETVKHAVEAATVLAQNLALDPREQVTVFVCTSLSGGTGGGTFLTVMNSIKTIPFTRTYGVVIGTSIADMQSNGHRARQEKANFRAGLMELDAWLSADSPLPEALGWDPFWPDAGRSVRGERPCADVVWLFDRRNADNGQFDTQLTAINASAEAIATWIHSSATQRIDSIDSDVMAAVADLDQQVPTVNRSIRYGAMGVAHLEFAADRALDYLASGLAVDVIRDHLTARQPGTQEQVTELVDGACRRWELIERGQDQILTVLRSLLQKAPRAPALAGNLNAAQSKNAFSQIVRGSVDRLEAPGGRQAVFKDACAEWVASRLQGSPDANGLRDSLRDEVKKIIASSGGGFAIAVEFLDALEASITSTEAADVKRELDDERDGLRAARDRLTKRRTKEVERLPARFGQDGRIRDFIGGWWKSWLDVNAEIAAREAALDIYQGLIDEIRIQQKAMAAARTLLDRLTSQLREQTENALKEPPESERGSKTTYLLTGNPSLVRHTFAPSSGAEEVAAALAQDPIDGLVTLFGDCLLQIRILAGAPAARPDQRRAQQLEQQAASRRLEAIGADPRYGKRLQQLCEAEFSAAVKACSVWDALEEEVRAAAPAARWEDLDHEAGRRLQELVSFSSPMFPFSPIGSVRAGLREPSESAILVGNVEAAVQFARRNGAGSPDDWLASWVRGPLRAAPSIVDTLDHQVLSVVRRSIGFPLLAALQGWGSEDETALRDVERTQFVWMDERAARLPRDFDPIDTDEISWITALAVDESILVEDEGGAWKWRNREIAPGLADLRRYLILLDRTTFGRLSEEVWQKIRERTVEEWEERLSKLETSLRASGSQQSGGGRATAERDALAQLRKVVSAKLNGLQAAEQPSVVALWPHAYQTQASSDISR